MPARILTFDFWFLISENLGMTARKRKSKAGLGHANRLGLRRDAVERMWKIEAQILAGKFPNAVGLAEEFEVSKDTIKRDIAFMIERLGKPIGYDAQRWGYYYTKPLDEVRSVTLSQADMLAMVAWHDVMPVYQGTPLEKPMQAAFEKLTGQLDSRELYTMQNLGDALSFSGQWGRR
jgi:predicted DNA-binding transcriptional regulator YafY